MSSPKRKFCFNGKQYTYEDLEAISGLNMKTLRSRVFSNPNISFEELISPLRTSSPYRLEAEINGVTKTLKEWARENQLSYDTMFHRYKVGVRGEALIKQPKYKQRTPWGIGPKPIMSKENIDWLLHTAKYRKGQIDEWEIACELIGAHSSWAGWLKREMEERGLING